MRSLRDFTLALVFATLPFIQGCPGDDELGLVSVRSGVDAGGEVTARINTGSSASPAPGQGPSPSPEPTPPPATPQPTATPQVSIHSVSVTPSFVILFLPAADPALALGYPAQAQLTAAVTRSDGAQGGIRWVDGSGGMLSISPGGLIAVKPTASPGTYTVQAQSLDDPRQSATVTVQVRSTAELDVIIQ